MKDAVSATNSFTSSSNYLAVLLRRSKMKPIKTSVITRLVALLFGAALFGLATQSTLAAPTAAGSTISNTATLEYKVGGVDQNSIDSSPTGNSGANTCTTTACVGTGTGLATAFLVDYKVDVLVLGGTFTNPTSGEAAGTNTATPGAYVTFTVQNLSNAPTDFQLTASDITAPVAVGAALGNKYPSVGQPINDTFDSTGLALFQEAGGAGLGAGDTALLGAGNKISLAAAGSAGDTATIYVASAIPLGTLDGAVSIIELAAQAHWQSSLPVWAPSAAANGNVAAVAGGTIVATAGGTPNNAGTTVDIVFADATDAYNTASDGIDIAYDAYLVQSAALSVTKTVALLCDPVNGPTNPKNIPGAAVQYAITITNTGSTSATLGQINDALSASVTWDGNLISGAGTPAECVTTNAATQLAPGSGFGAIYGTIPLATASPSTYTTYAAPGLTAQRVTAGAAGGATVVVTFGSLTAFTPLGWASIGVLPGAVAGTNMGSFITVYYNAFVQ
jgi:uncharacterized repeat protein (TIGR01451 family)